MKIHCPYAECLGLSQASHFKPFVRKGSYWRSSDGQRISRYQCQSCQRTFSSSRFTDSFLQKKRKANYPVFYLLSSGMSQRRAALFLHLDRKTVRRKLSFLGMRARKQHEAWLGTVRPLSSVQFDDLETSVHTKCKPVSVTLAVEPSSRKILGFQVSQMPAKGHLAEISRRKYGIRTDERMTGWNALFSHLKQVVKEDAVFLSDENPHYPLPLKTHFPNAVHETEQSRRGRSAGLGELKKIGFDPLFSLNHTCAMLRANLNRLFRKTWCTTKTKQGLIDHLSIYVQFHNQLLTQTIPECTR